jgi:hypothetical protein
MVLQPLRKGAVGLLQRQDGFRVFDGRIHLEAVADNAGIGQQAGAVFVGVGGYVGDAELVVSLAEGSLLFEDGFPAQPGLVDFQHQL